MGTTQVPQSRIVHSMRRTPFVSAASRATMSWTSGAESRPPSDATPSRTSTVRVRTPRVQSSRAARRADALRPARRIRRDRSVGPRAARSGPTGRVPAVPPRPPGRGGAAERKPSQQPRHPCLLSVPYASSDISTCTRGAATRSEARDVSRPGVPGSASSGHRTMTASPQGGGTQILDMWTYREDVALKPIIDARRLSRGARRQHRQGRRVDRGRQQELRRRRHGSVDPQSEGAAPGQDDPSDWARRAGVRRPHQGRDREAPEFDPERGLDPATRTRWAGTTVATT